MFTCVGRLTLYPTFFCLCRCLSLEVSECETATAAREHGTRRPYLPDLQRAHVSAQQSGVAGRGRAACPARAGELGPERARLTVGKYSHIHHIWEQRMFRFFFFRFANPTVTPSIKRRPLAELPRSPSLFRVRQVTVRHEAAELPVALVVPSADRGHHVHDADEPEQPGADQEPGLAPNGPGGRCVQPAGPAREDFLRRAPLVLVVVPVGPTDRWLPGEQCRPAAVCCVRERCKEGVKELLDQPRLGCTACVCVCAYRY